MPRKKYPRFDFYSTNFLDGVRGMPAAEVGDYIRLLAHMYDNGGTVEFNPDKLRHLLECRKVDVAKRIQKLIDREKIYIDTDGFLHNPRVDKQMEISPVCAQVGAKLGSSCAQVGAKLKPNAAKNATKSTKAGTSSRARAPSPSPIKEKEKEKERQSAQRIGEQFFNGSALAAIGALALGRRAPTPLPSTHDPPDYSHDPVEPSEALVNSALVRKYTH
jgi:hypothetical protein